MRLGGGVLFFFPAYQEALPDYLSTSTSNVHGQRHVSGSLASFTSLLVAGCVQASNSCISLHVCLVYCLSAAYITDCECRSWPISTNLASTEAGELGLTRGKCFVARRLELAAVAVLLCFWWCISSAAGFSFFFVCFPANAHGLRHESDNLSSFTSSLVIAWWSLP